MTQVVARMEVVAVPDTGAYYVSCLGAVLHLLLEQEPRPDTIIHVDYHEKDISLDPGNKEGYIPPGADMHIDWAAWLDKEFDDDDTLELWVYIDRDGWEVMRIEGPEGDVTEVAKLGLTAEADPSLVVGKLVDILTERIPLPADNSQT
jgi:hypothetical protein